MIADRYSDYMYQLVDRVVTEIGPRESCSEAEKEAGRLFAREVEPACDAVEMENFTCSPKAFMGFFPYLVILYAAGVVFYYFLPPVALILATLATAALFFEVVRYREFLDPLFPRREGESVIGTVRPSGEVRKRVIVSAHLDSAYEFKVWYWLKGLSVPVMAIAFAAPIVLIGASLARTIAGERGVPSTTAFSVLGIVLIALFIFVAPFFFFHTRDVVPGASDDMAGVGVVAGLGKYLREARESGEFFPRNTEVVLLALSSEEAGLRGSKRYAAKHGAALKSIPTYAVFLDGIYDERFLTVFKREIWCSARMDPYLVELAQDAAAANGFQLTTTVLSIGATDASAFAQAGISSVSMACQDTSRLVPNYHTRLDTMDCVRPQSLAVSLQMVIDMIRRIDA